VRVEVSFQGTGQALGQEILNLGASGPFARLTAVATVVEHEVDENGAYQWQMWESLSAAVGALVGG